MKKNSKEVFRAKHPKVMTFCTNPAEIEGALAVISDTVIEHRIVDLTKETYHSISRMHPQVLMMALHSVDESVKVYYELLNEVPFCQKKHRIVLLCEKTETEFAYQLCLRGLFDEFVVINPLYETYWLRLSVASGFRHCMNDMPHMQTAQFEFFEGVDSHLERMIAASVELRNKMDDDALKDTQDKVMAVTEPVEKVIEDKDDELKQNQQFKREQQLQMREVIDAMKRMDNHMHEDFERLTQQLSAQRALIQGQVQKMEDGLKQSTIDAVEPPKVQIMPPKVDMIQLDEASEGYVEDSLIAQNYTIMVVDDDPIYSEVLNKVLKGQGYETIIVHSGEQAIDVLDSDVPDLILLDLFMPVLDGVETTRKIRQLPNLRNLPIIGLSGNREKEPIMEWVKLGLNEYIVKPSSKKNILNKVAEALFSRGMGK